MHHGIYEIPPFHIHGSYSDPDISEKSKETKTFIETFLIRNKKI